MHQRNGLNAVADPPRVPRRFYPSQYELLEPGLPVNKAKHPNLIMIPIHDRGNTQTRHGVPRPVQPYRAEFSIGAPASNHHITKAALNGQYLRNTRYFDPGNKEGRSLLQKWIRDIVLSRYWRRSFLTRLFLSLPYSRQRIPDEQSYKKW